MSPPTEMPRFDKSPPELVERFGRVMGGRPRVTIRKMFGYPAAFTNEQMFTGLFGAKWMVRLPDDARAELLAIDGAEPFEPMPGRPMKGYAVFTAAIVEQDEALMAWVERAQAHAATLPPKPAGRR